MQSCKAGETTDYRPLGDRETILTSYDIRRAAITEAARDDVLPAMRFGVNCVDGVRRYAASYGEACRVFDEAARATLAKRGGQS